MSISKKLLKSVAESVADYRAGEIAPPTPKHVERWAEQFDVSVREPILTELAYVLERTYFARVDVESYLLNLVATEKLVGKHPRQFWKEMNLLEIQAAGRSQRELLAMFDLALQSTCGLKREECGGAGDVFLYLDDGVFSGNRIKNDIAAWISGEAPKVARLHIVTIACHRGGQWFANSEIGKAAAAAGKKIDVTWWRAIEIEDRKSHVDVSDVLRPTQLPNDALTEAYVRTLSYPVVLRKPGNVGGNSFFSSEAGRHLLEQEFLQAGARIRSICPHLNEYQRPLGNAVLQTLGFGTMLVTFRNCPNSCPLALWAGDPWYPLFPRKTN